MRGASSMALVATALVVTVGCEVDGGTGLLVGGTAGARDVAGSWTGTEEITGTDEIGGLPVGSIEQGIKFRVSLRLTTDRRFTLRVFGFPVANGTDRRVCRGVYARTGRTLEFFPDAVCRPLPLSRFVIGRTLPNGLTLEASTDRQPTGEEPVGDIRVLIRVQRD